MGKGRNEIPFIMGESVKRGSRYVYVCFSEDRTAISIGVEVQNDLILTSRSAVSV